MGVKVTIDQSAVNNLKKAADEAAKAALLAVEAEVKDTVPLDSGALQGDFSVNTIEEGKRYALSNSTVYSRYLYYEKLMVGSSSGKAFADKGERKVIAQPERKLKFRHGRRGHWFEPYLTGDKKDFVTETFKEKYKERAKL